MVSLKHTSLITAVIVITLIVLTIIDRVFSEDEVKKCTRYIKQLYRYRVLHLDDPSYNEILPTLNDESIGIDPVKMFKKGFLIFNTTDIHLINSNILDKKDSSPDPQELKEIIKDMIGDYYANFEVPSKTNRKLERYSKEAEEKSEVSDLKFIIRRVQEIVSGRYNIISNPAEKQYLVSKMDEYTIGYFKEFLNKVSINGKENLNNPAESCTELFPGEEDNIATCTEIIKKKFKLNDTISGSEIFDILYKEWSDYQVNEVYKLKEEMAESHRGLNMFSLHLILEASQKRKLLTDSLQHFYKQFENILDQADFSHMSSPLQFCDEYINGASTTLDSIDNSDAIDEDFESLNN